MAEGKGVASQQAPPEMKRRAEREGIEPPDYSGLTRMNKPLCAVGVIIKLDFVHK